MPTDAIYEATNLSWRRVIRCTDCGSWVDAEEGGVVRHSKRCDHADDRTPHPGASHPAPAPKPVSTDDLVRQQAAAERLRRDGTTVGFRTEDEILAAVQRGFLSPGEAMNRDD